MTIIDTTTVSVLFALVAFAIVAAVVAVWIAAAKAHASHKPARAAAPRYVPARPSVAH